jgi:NADH-ubiquinone oxidoreductase chain 2
VDVYDGIPTIITTFVAIVAKISILILLLELVHYTCLSTKISMANSSYFVLPGASDASFVLTDNASQTSLGSEAREIKIKYSWSSTLLYSSLLSLIIGTVVGLTQFRIKRLFAYSTISHVGFILLAISINSIESIQAFIFYLMQYSISNLNAFMIIIAIGYSLFYYVNNNKEFQELKDKNNSPIQLISQMKGYFYINAYLALSLAITIFSFAGIPPLMGFFAKQMVLSAALDSGYLFLTLIAILTSVVGAVYYLGVIKQVFFDKSEYKINPIFIDTKTKAVPSWIVQWYGMPVEDSIVIKSYTGLVDIDDPAFITESYDLLGDKPYFEHVSFNLDNVVLSSYLTITISILTLITIFFIFIPKEWLNLVNILALILWNT